MNLLIKLIISIFILPPLMFINSVLFFDYLIKFDDKKINFLNCEYWNNTVIPDNLTDSHKWKVITTIGECKIYSKKYYLEKNINYEKEFGPNLKYYTKHRAKYISSQAKLYLKHLNGVKND